MGKKNVCVVILLFLISCSKDKIPSPAVKSIEKVINFSPSQSSLISGMIATPYSVILSNDGNFLITGQNSGQVFVLKRSLNGEIIWENNFSTSTELNGVVIEETINGDIYVLGNYHTIDSTKLAVYKFTNQGNLVWSKFYADNIHSTATKIVDNGNGELFILANSTESLYEIFKSQLILKINDNGDIIWSKNGINGAGGRVLDLFKTADGNLLYSSLYGSNSFFRYKYIVKLHQDGSEIWSQKINTGWSSTFQIFELANGNLFGQGNVSDEPDSSGDDYNYVAFFETDMDGNVLATKSIQTDLGITFIYATRLNQNLFNAIGYSDVENQFTLYQTNTNSEINWISRVNANATISKFEAMSIINNNDINYIIGNYDNSIFIMKTTNDGELIP